MKISVSAKGPKKADFSKDELELLDIDNLQETVYDVKWTRKFTDDDYIAVAEMLKLETKLPLKYLKPIQNACVYIASKGVISKDNQSAVYIEPMNPDWTNGQIRFLPINQSIPLDTVFTISKTIPQDGKFEWVMSSDLKCTKNLKELILSENPKAKSFDLTNQKVYLFGQDIGSKIEGKFKVAMTDEIFDNLRLFRFKRPELDHLQFFVYNFMNVSLKDILEKMINQTKSELCKQLCKEIMEHLH